MTTSPPASGTRFDFGRCLGAGGFGEVYLAKMTTHGGLSREVAVKLLLAGIDPGGVARLRDEARMLAALNHPAILQVYDLVGLEGRPALVTEYIDGCDVSTLITETGPLPPRVAVEIVGAVAGALHAALITPVDGVPLGLVHRDIKPGNIRIARIGSVKLLDFGIAVASGMSREARTGTGLIIGTLGYLAPERLTEPEIQPPSDIYALGCVLYEALVGERLFGGLTQSRLLKLAMNQGDHDSLLAERLAAGAAHLPAELVPLLRRTVAFDAADRMDAHALELACDEVASTLRGSTLKRWVRERAWREPEQPNGPLRGRTIEVSASVAAGPTGYTVGTPAPLDAPRPRRAPPRRSWLLVAGIGSLVVLLGLGLSAAIAVVGGFAWVAAARSDVVAAPLPADPLVVEPAPAPDVAVPERTASRGAESTPAPAPEPPAQPPAPVGESLTLPGGLVAPIPAGWKGQAADATKAVMVSPDGNNLLIVALEDAGGADVRGELSNTIDAGDGVTLHPSGTPHAELGGYANEFSVSGWSSPVRASVMARTLSDGRTLAIIGIAALATYDVMREGQREVFRGARGGRSAVSTTGAGTWTSELSGRYLVKIYNGNGYAEKHELWLCSDGTFAYTMDGGGFTQGVGSGAFGSGTQGTWSAAGASGAAGTLTLSATDGSRVQYDAQAGNDGIYLNGDRWMRGDNARCR